LPALAEAAIVVRAEPDRAYTAIRLMEPVSVPGLDRDFQSSDSREVDPNPRVTLDDLRKVVAAVWAAENDAGASVDVHGPDRPGCTTAATGANRGCHLNREHLLK
jgi:hypothetical protein